MKIKNKKIIMINGKIAIRHKVTKQRQERLANEREMT